MKPLADIMRPDKIDDVVGQRHLIGSGKLLNNILKSRDIPNMIFYGPSGTGKTTVANICANVSEKTLFKINATNSSIKDIRDITSKIGTFEAQKGILLYLDEIQNFNKKQQQALLEYTETGDITLIASTTENPYFYIYNALLSRSTVLEFKPVEQTDIANNLKRCVQKACEVYNRQIILNDDIAFIIAGLCAGDVRKSINILEICIKSLMFTDGDKPITITEDTVAQATNKSQFAFDRDGDSHYDTLSAFQKSIRGSDPDAAVHYLARLIKADDLPSICRRLTVVAAEDIGLAYPNAIAVTNACVESALRLGFPEARIPLAEAVIFLASLPKSNSAICAIDAALADIDAGKAGNVPLHLKDSHYSGAKKLGRGTEYKYPHNYPGSYVKQQYLPDSLTGTHYYMPGNNKMENSLKNYLNSLK